MTGAGNHKARGAHVPPLWEMARHEGAQKGYQLTH